MTDAKLKHLEMIQSIVSRQAKNSFQAKSWAIVLLAGLAGLSRGSKTQILLICAGVVVIFWLLDAYYLAKERLYRNFYERTSQEATVNMSLRPAKADHTAKTKWFRAVIAPVEVLPYGAMAVAIIIVMLGAK
jgi:hypothetical protein